MNIIQPKLKWNGALIPLNLNNVKYLIIHHPEAKVASIEEIHQWHIQNGWAGCGYNEYIRKDGTVYIGRGDNIGAQCANYNSQSYGICCEGNYDVEIVMPQAQYTSLIERLKYHMNRLPNTQQIVPHKQLGQTNCPGKYFPSIAQIVNDVNKPVDHTLLAIDKLVKNGIMKSPEYWEQNAKTGKVCNGEYVALLLQRLAAKL